MCCNFATDLRVISSLVALITYDGLHRTETDLVRESMPLRCVYLLRGVSPLIFCFFYEFHIQIFRQIQYFKKQICFFIEKNRGSINKKKSATILVTLFTKRRGDTTRTCDHLVPNQVHYQLCYTPILRVQNYYYFLEYANRNLFFFVLCKKIGHLKVILYFCIHFFSNKPERL